MTRVAPISSAAHSGSAPRNPHRHTAGLQSRPAETPAGWSTRREVLPRDLAVAREAEPQPRAPRPRSDRTESAAGLARRDRALWRKALRAVTSRSDAARTVSAPRSADPATRAPDPRRTRLPRSPSRSTRRRRRPQPVGLDMLAQHLPDANLPRGEHSAGGERQRGGHLLMVNKWEWHSIRPATVSAARVMPLVQHGSGPESEPAVGRGRGRARGCARRTVPIRRLLGAGA